MSATESMKTPSVSPATIDVSRFAAASARRFCLALAERDVREVFGVREVFDAREVFGLVSAVVSPVVRLAPMRIPSRRPARGRS